MSISFNFYINLTVVNPPAFTTALVDKSVTVGFPITYTLPTYINYDISSPIAMSLMSPPSFVKISSSGTITISPTSSSSVGVYTIFVLLADTASL
jgi:hypothetical protein